MSNTPIPILAADGGRNGPKIPSLATHRATLQVLPGLFGQFQKGSSRKFGCSRGGLLTLRSVLLEHVTYILNQCFELPHLFLTKLLDAFVLYARYDLISYPPQLPSSLR
jgi:hypothetical protein